MRGASITQLFMPNRPAGRTRPVSVRRDDNDSRFISLTTTDLSVRSVDALVGLSNSVNKAEIIQQP